jgi:hypothetical protein
MVGLGEEEAWVAVVVAVVVEVGWVGTECAARVSVGVSITGRSGTEDGYISSRNSDTSEAPIYVVIRLT